MEIREATAADLSDILNLYKQPEMDGENILGVNRATEIFEQFAQHPFYKLFVVECEEKMVGTYALLIMPNLGHMGALSGIVEDVVVASDQKRKGIGKFMMEHAMQLCRERGCYKLALSSNRNRVNAHTFYESLGFKKHGYSFLVEF